MPIKYLNLFGDEFTTPDWLDRYLDKSLVLEFELMGLTG